MSEPLWIWMAFNAFVLVMITLDLFVFHRNSKVISIKQGLLTSILWIGMALVFNYGLFVYRGEAAALNFFTGYLIEKSLSIDNLFVFILIFDYFKTPSQYHHKVLFWGILGAIILRALFIFFGIALVNTLHWVFYVFGAFLLYTAIKMALPKAQELHPENNLLIKLLKKWISFTSDYVKDRFFIRREGKLWATLLFLVLLSVESADLIFAMDSIPAIMGITRDPFIIYTSNIFAIMGLRSLYFALAGLLPYFHFLNYGLAAILGFIGLKMLFEPVIEVSIFHSLGFIAAALILSVSASLLFPKQST